MGDWIKFSSTVRASNSFESISRSNLSTNRSHADRSHNSGKSKSKETRRKLEERLHSVLSEFNGSISKTREKTQKVMKLIEKYCRFRSHVSTSSHETKATSTPKSAGALSNATKPSNSTTSTSAGKSSSVTKPTKSAPTQKHATKLLAPSKSPDVGTQCNAMVPFNASKPPEISKAKPHVRTPAKNTSNTLAELRLELQRLADSDGFVPLYPSRYKRQPKPVERFSITQYDENRARRSSRASVHRRQSHYVDEADVTPKKKEKPTENRMVIKLQQLKTVSETTSTTG